MWVWVVVWLFVLALCCYGEPSALLRPCAEDGWMSWTWPAESKTRNVGYDLFCQIEEKWNKQSPTYLCQSVCYRESWWTAADPGWVYLFQDSMVARVQDKGQLLDPFSIIVQILMFLSMQHHTFTDTYNCELQSSIEKFSKSDDSFSLTINIKHTVSTASAFTWQNPRINTKGQTVNTTDSLSSLRMCPQTSMPCTRSPVCSQKPSQVTAKEKGGWWER